MATSQLLRPFLTATTFPAATAGNRSSSSFAFPSSPSHLPPRRKTSSTSSLFLPTAKGKKKSTDRAAEKLDEKHKAEAEKEEEEEVEEELPWIQDKALDLVEFTGTVAEAVPGPRVGTSKLPWILAVPLAYVGVSFVVAFVKTVRRYTSPRAHRKRLVNKNATLLKSIDDLFVKSKDGLQHSSLQGLMKETGFTMEDILRKYIRYILNEKPFNPDVVVDLINLRKASQLDNSQVAEVLNEVSRRIVKEKGPVVMNLSGFTEKGFKRKLAVQALFGKILYLSELPEFCSRDGSLAIKEIFGVTDDDVDTLRISTLSKSGDVDSLEKMVDDSDSGESTDAKSSVA